MRFRLVLWVLLAALILAAFPGGASGQPVHAAQAVAAAQQEGSVVVVLRWKGPIHPAMLEHLKRARQVADREAAQAMVIELDTPGGSIDLMNELVQQIRGNELPVIVYVSPRGAMAASAGTLITLAGHLSAMAPETSIGAASPVGSEGQDIGETMESKVKEMLRASARSLTVGRPPEAVKLAEEMIQDARAVSVDEAVEIGLVDLKASSLRDLLEQADGREVMVQDEQVVLHTAGARVVQVENTFLEEMLMVLSNPNIAFLLLAIGVQAILIEISSPGGWVAGFIGAVCLLLATYGLGVLPVNWFGVLFMVVAFVLFVLDIKAPTHGALTAAGVASFIVGALVLFNSPNVPSFQRVSIPLVVGTGFALGLVFFTILGFALRAQRSPIKMGREALVGQVGIVNTPLDPTGTVQLGSELWTAVLEDHGTAARRGERVEVVGLENLRIRVRKLKDEPQ